MRTIILKDLIKECATKESGTLLYNELEQSVNAKEDITIDFESMDKFAGAFFNNSFGKLIITHETDHVLKYITLKHISSTGRFIYDLTITNALWQLDNM